jgi:hypothetical protein
MNVVAIAGCSILGRKGVGDARQPLAEQRVNLVSREPIAELLQSSGVGTAQNAVVQGFEGYPFLGQLLLDVLMAVDAERYIRSMPSTFRVTCCLRTSATESGKFMGGSGRHDPSGSTNRFAV